MGTLTKSRSVTTGNALSVRLCKAQWVDVIFYTETTDGEEEETAESDDGKKEKEDEEDECDYAALNKDHTMLLPPNPDCKVNRTGITDEERDLILQLHNELRAQVSTTNTHTKIDRRIDAPTNAQIQRDRETGRYAHLHTQYSHQQT